MSGLKGHSGSPPQPGWVSLVVRIYQQAVLDYRTAKRYGYNTYPIACFLVSGAYEVEPEVGRAILRKLEEESA